MRKLKYALLALIVLVAFSFTHAVKEMNMPKYSGEQLFRGIFLFEGEIPYKLGSYDAILASLDKMDGKTKLKQAVFANTMVEKVSTIAPGYFNELRSAIGSRDNYKVDQAIAKGSQLMQVALSQTKEYAALMKIPESSLESIDYNKYDLSKDEDLKALVGAINDKVAQSKKKGLKQEENAIAIPLVAVAAVVVLAIWDAVAAVNYGAVATAAALAVVWAAVYAKVVFWPKADELEQANLQRERIINDIVLNV